MTSTEAEARAALAAATWLFAQEPQFLRGASDVGDLPLDEVPEVAFAGRSNVGKSSLINALCNRRELARVSNTPGRTQQLNLFALTGGLRLVDLPGYGFAKAPRATVDRWTGLIFDYLRGRPMLRRVMLLIDARHGLKPPDLGAMRELDEAAVSYQIVLTKTDKLKPHELSAVLSRTAREVTSHAAAHPEILPTSSLTKEGLDGLRLAVASLADWRRIDYATTESPRSI